MRVRRPRARERSLLPLMVALALGVFLGRTSAARRSEPVAPPAAGMDASIEPDAGPSPVAVTSTIAMCPCPPPRPPRAPAVARVRRPIPPPRSPSPPPDPTEAVARYLRSEAARFASCAPASGDPLRVHLEIAIRPDGSVESARIANLDPLPEEVSSCVARIAAQLSPPPFGGSAAEVFALTLVL